MELPQTLARTIGTSILQQPRPFVAAICGWADTGKSTLARRLCAALVDMGIDAETISTDDFMRDRAERHALGVTGYNERSLDARALQAAIAHFVSREPFNVHAYDNRTGTKSLQPKTVLPVQVLVVEGIHALHAAISEKMGLRVFIDSDEATLRQMRYRANLAKRGMTPEAAGARISHEWMDYNVFLRPRMAIADLVIEVDKGYVYTARAGSSPTRPDGSPPENLRCGSRG